MIICSKLPGQNGCNALIWLILFETCFTILITWDHTEGSHSNPASELFTFLFKTLLWNQIRFDLGMYHFCADTILAVFCEERLNLE